MITAETTCWDIERKFLMRTFTCRSTFLFAPQYVNLTEGLNLKTFFKNLIISMMSFPNTPRQKKDCAG
jgi:hypothetical protein